MASWIGYHGTVASNIDSIKQYGYQPSGANEWFGVGVYFFGDMRPISDGKNEAKWWVLNIKNESEWAVFKAQIASEKVIDLVENWKDKKLFQQIREELFQKHCASGKDPLIFKDRTVLKKLEQQNAVDVMRALVDGSKHQYPAYVMMRPQIQICVKNTNAIKGNELIAQGSGNVLLN